MNCSHCLITSVAAYLTSSYFPHNTKTYRALRLCNQRHNFVHTFMQNQSSIMNPSCNVFQAIWSMIDCIQSTHICKQCLKDKDIVTVTYPQLYTNPQQALGNRSSGTNSLRWLLRIKRAALKVLRGTTDRAKSNIGDLG